MPFHHSLGDAASSAADLGTDAAGELWSGVEDTASFVADETRRTGEALRSPLFALSSTTENVGEAAADLTSDTGEGVRFLLGGTGKGLRGIGQGTGDGLRATGKGVENLGTFGGIGIGAMVALAIGVFLVVEVL